MNRFLLCAMVLVSGSCATEFSAAAPITGRVTWNGKAPPVRYLRGAELAAVMAGNQANPNPPVDFDLDGDKKNDSWSYPTFLFLPRQPGSPKVEMAAKTDEDNPNPGSIFVVGVPDPRGAGFGADHFSGRFVRKNDPTPGGVEVGACVYTIAANSWFLDFEDANNNKVPDKFLKSIWRSRNADARDPDFGERTYFVADLSQKKVAAQRVIRKRTQPGIGKISYSITDMSIFSLGIDPTAVPLEGKPIGLPEPLPNGADTDDVFQFLDEEAPLEMNRLTGITDALLPGHMYSILGEIENTDEVSHEFSLTHFGVNATLLNSPEPMLIGPGQIASYELQFRANGPGDVGIATMAYSETGGEADGWLDSEVMRAVPEPAAVVLSFQTIVALCIAWRRRTQRFLKQYIVAECGCRLDRIHPMHPRARHVSLSQSSIDSNPWRRKRGDSWV